MAHVTSVRRMNRLRCSRSSMLAAHRGVGEARPPRAGVELRLGGEQLRRAGRAAVHAVVLCAHISAAEGWTGTSRRGSEPGLSSPPLSSAVPPSAPTHRSSKLRCTKPNASMTASCSRSGTSRALGAHRARRPHGQPLKRHRRAARALRRHTTPVRQHRARQPPGPWWRRDPAPQWQLASARPPAGLTTIARGQRATDQPQQTLHQQPEAQPVERPLDDSP